MYSIRIQSLLAVFVLFTGCNEGGGSTDRQDAQPTDSNIAVDAGSVMDVDDGVDPPLLDQGPADAAISMDMATGSGLGEGCTDHSDCTSRLCIWAMPAESGLCSRDCSEQNCPMGWFCADAPNDERRCVPEDQCVDFDSDGFGQGAVCATQDCDDGNGDTHVGAAELCDGEDNDCDERTDEEVAGEGTDCNTGEPGPCSMGWQTCQLGESVCVPRQAPQDESCNNIDDDCDGHTDESLTQACGSDVGLCETGLSTCFAGEWSVCQGQTEPVMEQCNGLDDDCDGVVDDVGWLGTQTITDERWNERRTFDRTIRPMVAGRADGRRYAVMYTLAEPLGGLGPEERNIALSIIDMDDNSVASHRLFERVHDGGTALIDLEIFSVRDHWWILSVNWDSTSGQVRGYTYLYRFDEGGQPLGEPRLLNTQGRYPTLVTKGDRVVIVSRVGRSGVYFDELTTNGDYVRSFSAGCGSLDCPYAVGTTPTGWLLLRYDRINARGDKALLIQAYEDGEPSGELVRVNRPGRVGSDNRYWLFQTGEGQILVTDTSGRGWSLTAFDENGVPGEPVMLHTEEFEHMNRSPILRSISYHGALGGLLIKEEVQTRPSSTYFYSRVSSEGEFILNRGLLLMNEDEEPRRSRIIRVGGPGPEIGLLWEEPFVDELGLTRRELRFTRSPFLGCVDPN